jgi:hypothetical protein
LLRLRLDDVAASPSDHARQHCVHQAKHAAEVDGDQPAHDDRVFEDIRNSLVETCREISSGLI